MSAPLSPAEQAIVDRFDAAEPAPESLRERVVDVMGWHAIWAFNGSEVACECDDRIWMKRSVYSQHLADAAIAVLTGGAS